MLRAVLGVPHRRGLTPTYLNNISHQSSVVPSKNVRCFLTTKNLRAEEDSDLPAQGKDSRPRELVIERALHVNRPGQKEEVPEEDRYLLDPVTVDIEYISRDVFAVNGTHYEVGTPIQSRNLKRIAELKEQFELRANFIAKIRILQDWFPRMFNTRMSELHAAQPSLSVEELKAFTAKTLEKEGHYIPSEKVLTANTFENTTPQLEVYIKKSMDKITEMRRSKTHPEIKDEIWDQLARNAVQPKPGKVKKRDVQVYFEELNGGPLDKIDSSLIPLYRQGWMEDHAMIEEMLETKEENEYLGVYEAAKEFTEQQAASRRRAKGLAFFKKIYEIKAEKKAAAKAQKQERQREVMSKVNPRDVPVEHLDGFGEYFPHLLSDYPRDHPTWRNMYEIARSLSRNATVSQNRKEETIKREKKQLLRIDKDYIMQAYERIGLTPEQVNLREHFNVYKMSEEVRNKWDSFMMGQIQNYENSFSPEKWMEIRRRKEPISPEAQEKILAAVSAREGGQKKTVKEPDSKKGKKGKK